MMVSPDSRNPSCFLKVPGSAPARSLPTEGFSAMTSVFISRNTISEGSVGASIPRDGSPALAPDWHRSVTNSGIACLQGSGDPMGEVGAASAPARDDGGVNGGVPTRPLLVV